MGNYKIKELRRFDAGDICGGSFSSARIGEKLILRLQMMQDTESVAPTISGLSTGFNRLDGMIDGLHAGELIVVAGRPSMGQNILVRQIGLHVAINLGINVAYFSTEKNRELALRNLISLDAKVEWHGLHRNTLSEEAWQNFSKSSKNICNAPIIINDASADPRVLRKEVKKLFLNSFNKPGLIIFDKIPTGDDCSSSIGRRLSSVAEELISIARNNNVPVIAIAGVSRDVEDRKCKKPMLKDVASADGIHWYADTVITLVRDVVYDPDTEHPDFAQVSVLKSFYGLIGGFQLELSRQSQYFSEMQLKPPKIE